MKTPIYITSNKVVITGTTIALETIPYISNASILILGGGGCGGFAGGINTFYPGGGGAGEYLYLTGITITSSNIVIGSGGTIDTIYVGDGRDTTFLTYTAHGGGGGGGRGYEMQTIGRDGASGGGGTTDYDRLTITNGGSGLYGYNGKTPITGSTLGGGGGGSSSAAVTTNIGGNGTINNINGTSIAYCRGGNGADINTKNANAGTNNKPGSGGFAGGNGNYTPTSGINGLVIIRYTGSQQANGGTITTVGSDTVHTFNTNGTFTII